MYICFVKLRKNKKITGETTMCSIAMKSFNKKEKKSLIQTVILGKELG